MEMYTYNPKNPYFAQDVDKLCAVCTKMLVPGNIFPLTSTVSKSYFIKACETLEEISEFRFHMDGPQSLCPTCFKNTQSVFEFKELCNTSHSYFVEYSQYQEHLADKANLVIEDTVVKFEIDDYKVDSATAQHQEQLADTANTVTEDTVVKLEINDFNVDSAEAQISSSDCTESYESVNTLNPVGFSDGKINCKDCYSGERPHKRTATFVQSPSLKYHKNSHKKIRKYICEYCGKAFGTSSHLRVHERRHNGVRPHQCPECEKTFATSTCLQRHRAVHTSEKPFTCEYCAKSFSRKTTLYLHVKIHTGERPHVCSECGKSFIHRHRLRTHLRTHDRLQDAGM